MIVYFSAVFRQSAKRTLVQNDIKICQLARAVTGSPLPYMKWPMQWVGDDLKNISATIAISECFAVWPPWETCIVVETFKKIAHIKRLVWKDEMNVTSESRTAFSRSNVSTLQSRVLKLGSFYLYKPEKRQICVTTIWELLICTKNVSQFVHLGKPCMYVCNVWKTLFNDASHVNSSSWFPQGASLAQENDIYNEKENV